MALKMLTHVAYIVQCSLDIKYIYLQVNAKLQNEDYIEFSPLLHVTSAVFDVAFCLGEMALYIRY